MSLRERIDKALQDSIDSCARCKTCDKQVDAVMRAVQEEIVLRVRLARRRDLLFHMEETDAPEIIIAEQRRMVAETMEQLGEVQ